MQVQVVDLNSNLSSFENLTPLNFQPERTKLKLIYQNNRSLPPYYIEKCHLNKISFPEVSGNIMNFQMETAKKYPNENYTRTPFISNAL